MKNYTNCFYKIFGRNNSILFLILSIIILIPEIGVSQSLSTVNLGTSGDYVILSKTGISTSGTTSIVGNIGVSPAAATYITGFGLIIDASGIFSTSSLITGKIYASDYITPTPSNMTTAISDMETASTDAAGRTSPDFTELYSGDLTGQTLIPGLYKWGTNVLISGGGVTISGSSSDVWIFQIAQNLDLANGAAVNLIGGAKASNIFWQVSGQTTLGTTSSMHGIILCNTQIVMNTSATLNGRALSQTAVTLDANRISTSGVTAIENEENIPLDFSLSQNYPNPFNPSTIIQYSIDKSAYVSLKVYNILGIEVASLVNKNQDAGVYSIVFNANNNLINKGRTAALASGIYIYRLEAGSLSATKKLVLLK